MRVQEITQPVVQAAYAVATTIAELALQVYRATKAFFVSFTGLFVSFALLDMFVPQGWKLAAQTTFAYGYTSFNEWRSHLTIRQLQTHLAGQTERRDRQQTALAKLQAENAEMKQWVASQQKLQEATQIVTQNQPFDILKMVNTLSEKEAQHLVAQFKIGVVV